MTTQRLPLFPLGTVLTPGMPLSLHVFEPRYRQLVADLLDDQDPRAPEFGVVALRQGWEVGALGDVHPVGTSARVTDVLPLPDGRCDLSAVGERRFRIEELHPDERPYLMATVTWLPEPLGPVSTAAVEATRRAISRHDQALRALNVEYEQPGIDPDVEDPQTVSYQVARLASLPLVDRQRLLGEPDTATRLASARAVLRRETELILQLRAIPVSAASFHNGPTTS